MRVALSTALFASVIGTGSAFALAGKRPFSRGDRTLFSTVETSDVTAEAAIINDDAAVVQVLNVDLGAKPAAAPSPVASTSAEIKSRLDEQLAKLREKDATSKRLTKEVSDVCVESPKH
jgi:hypothetical protein